MYTIVYFKGFYKSNISWWFTLYLGNDGLMALDNDGLVSMYENYIETF